MKLLYCFFGTLVLSTLMSSCQRPLYYEDDMDRMNNYQATSVSTYPPPRAWSQRNTNAPTPAEPAPTNMAAKSSFGASQTIAN